MAGVCSITHTSNVPLIGFLSNGGSSKRRKSDEDDMSFDSLSGSKKRKVREKPFLIPENAKVISIDDDNDDDEGSEQCDEKMFESVFDVKKEVKSGESGGSGEFYAKDGTVENPITISSDEYGESEEDHSKKRKLKEEPFVVPKNAKVIFIDVGDWKMFEGDYDVKKDVKSDESGEFDAEDGNFVEEKRGWTLGNPITIHSDEEHSVGSDSNDEEEEEHDDNVKQGEKSGGSYESADKDIFFVDLDDSDESDEEQYSVGSGSDSDSNSDDDVKEGAKSGGRGEFVDKDDFFVDLDDYGESDEEYCFDSDESEENETSDEEFRVDELNEISDNDDDSSSSSPYNDGKEKDKKKGGRKYFNVAEELVRETNDKHSGISEMNNEEVKDKSPSVNNDEVEHSDYGSVATSTTFEKKGSSSNKNDTSKKQKAKSVENVSDNDVIVAKAKERDKPNETVNLRDDVSVAKAKCKSQVKAKDNAKAKPNESVDVADSGEGKEHVKGLDVGGVSLVQTKQEMMKESRKQKMVENKVMTLGHY